MSKKIKIKFKPLVFRKEFEEQRDLMFQTLKAVASREKRLEKRMERFEKLIREAQTDRNGLATRITRLETKYREAIH